MHCTNGAVKIDNMYVVKYDRYPIRNQIDHHKESKHNTNAVALVETRGYFYTLCCEF